ncbi:MAG: molecular chaperone HtpG [Promethearchaeota archaeon]
MSEENKHEFKAEIKKLLDILSKSLYQHKEIFLRELISNSSDALKKVQFLGLQSKDIENPDLDYEINIILDQEKNTLTVNDTGLGMSKEDLITSLGTIAGSGSQKFLEHLEQKNGDQKEVDLDIIGQFGIGFYSVFMVAQKVEVTSKSYLSGEPAHQWISDGTGEFEINEIQKDSRGTEVVLYLKEGEEEFFQVSRIENIIKKYSNFVSYPIYITEIKKPEDKIEVDMDEEDGEGAEENAEKPEEPETPEEPTREPVNEIHPIWKRAKSEISEEDYINFYHYLSKRYDNYLKVINYTVDGRVQFRTVLFIPETKSQDLLRPEVEYGLTLYSKNVMVIEKSKEIIPQWMRFITGIVDSDDIPLNLSRDTIQTNRFLMKIETLIVKRFFKELNEFSADDPEKYTTFWKEFGTFIKEGIVTDQIHKDKLLELLRFKTNKTADGEYIGLKDYVERMDEDQKDIYYLIGENLEGLKMSPHLGYYEQQGYEVIFFDEAIDNFLMMNVHQYTTTIIKDIEEPTTEEKKEGEDAEETEEEVSFAFKPIDVTEEEKKSKDDADDSEDSEEKSDEDEDIPENMKNFLAHVKEILGEKIVDAKVSKRLYKNASRLANPSGGMTSSMQRAMRYWTQSGTDKSFQIPRKVFEFNPAHELVEKLVEKFASDPEDQFIDPVIEQMFENCLLAEGDLPEPASMVPRLNQILELMIVGKKITEIPVKQSAEHDDEEESIQDAEIVKDDTSEDTTE